MIFVFAKCQFLLRPRHTKHRRVVFGTLFFEVLPFTDEASVVNAKTSKKSMQKRCAGFWCVKTFTFEERFVRFS